MLSCDFSLNFFYSWVGNLSQCGNPNGKWQLNLSSCFAII